MSSYGCKGLYASYATGPFPVIPRVIAATSISPTPAPTTCDTTVFFTFREPATSTLSSKDAERESVAVTYTDTSRTVVSFLGASGKSVDVSGLRKATTAAVTKLRALKVTNATFSIPEVAGIPSAVVASAIVQASMLSNYAFDRYLTIEDKKASLVSSLHFKCPCKESEEAAHKAIVLANATIFARDLENERADEMHPERLEAVARGVAAEVGASVYSLANEGLMKEGLHLLHAVGQASRYGPRYVELFHKGDTEHPEDIMMIVGKGITFDSGGLNIKPTGSIENMHQDMGGSAAVLGAFKAVATLGIKRNVVAVIAVAENAIGENAFKPHNIIRSHKGLTVEIKNTDAEGRLVLADALSYAQSRYPTAHTIIDLATLTGACVIALGEYAAGMFTNNEALKESLRSAGETHFERLWPLPIFPEHREELKAASMADLQSTGEGRYGGSCTAAAFLENFIGAGKAWAHLDIAGPAMTSKPRGHTNAGGTGFGVQAVAEYLLTSPPGALKENAKKPY